LRVIHQRHVDVKLTQLEHDQFGGNQWWFGRISFSRNDSNEIDGFRLTGGRVRNLRFDRIIE
jgi:hypothetical protein